MDYLKTTCASQLKAKWKFIDLDLLASIALHVTLSYSLVEQYHQYGFEIIGIHTPEFEFEKKLENVQQAVKKFGIHYPVALDNHYATWQNFNNHYWPAHFLINKEGEVVYEHAGEGEYDVTENNIRYLLGMRGAATEKKSVENVMMATTPETYLGYERSDRFSNVQVPLHGKAQDFHYPSVIPQDSWALQGKWIIYRDKIVAADACSD